MESNNTKDKNNPCNEEQALDLDLDLSIRDIGKNLQRSFMRALSRPLRRNRDKPPL